MGSVNGVLVLTHNNLKLNKKCIESIQNQDIPTYLFVFDNGSTDGTSEWLVECGFAGMAHPENKGVSAGWNIGLEFLFEDPAIDNVLVLNSDTILPPWFYRTLLECNVPFVTGVSFEDLAEVMKPPTVSLTGGPDFSAFLIRREAWEKVGPFNEDMKHYASDNDWHVRAHRAGVMLYNSHVKFYHERSSTLKNAGPKDQREIQLQADADRDVFKEIYGVYPWEKGYAELFKQDG